MNMETAFRRSALRNQYTEHAERVGDILAQPSFTADDMAQIALRFAMMQSVATRIMFSEDHDDQKTD
jgi:hypothetical protein